MKKDGFMFFVWLFLYGSITFVAEHFSSLNAWIIPAGQLVNTLILIGWLKIRGQERLLTFGLHTKLHRRTRLWGLAYLLPVVCQIMYFGVRPRSAIDILCILLAVIQEEILFRGILLSWLGRFGRTRSIILSGIIFAAAHLLNLAEGMEQAGLILQPVYAMAAGSALSGLAMACESLIPCIGIHFLNNLTANDSVVLPTGYLPWFWLCVMIYLVCGIKMICFLNKLNSGRKY